jgi:hypothetical protein
MAHILVVDILYKEFCKKNKNSETEEVGATAPL